MVATTNCRPDCASSASDLLVKSTTCSGRSRCAWSTTRPVSGGKCCAAAGDASANSASHRTAKTRATSARGVEIDARRGLGGGRRFERHLRLGAVEDLGADRVGEGADAGVIAGHRLVIVTARGVDAVLGPLELVLKREEVRVGLEVGVILVGREKPAKRPAELVLRILERLDLGRIAEVAGVELDAGCAGAGIGHI